MNGYDLLTNTNLNKSTAFTEAERDALGLRGLLPPAVCTQEVQLARALENLRRKTDDIEKFIYLQALEARNQRLFYRLVMENVDEIMPLIYTPTVGRACEEFAHIFRQAKGLYLTAQDRGRVAGVLENWPETDVRVVVITDGERILGLGDLGANGMGIPIGKLALYTALAGINPLQTLPIMLDVGTENTTLREDPLYLGLDQPRVRGADYVELVDEVMAALLARFPNCLIQFEDFATPNAFAILQRYQNRCLCFNDDIQGTAAVALAGVYAASRATNVSLQDMKIMFLGAGSAATGIGDLLAQALQAEGLGETEAAHALWFVNSGGLVVREREAQLQPHNLAYAHDHPQMSFAQAVDTIKPHVLIGATGSPGVFSEEIVRSMARNHEQPVIFALSNPTTRAECTAQQAYAWSDGRALFASGSPFAPVTYKGQLHRPGQGNNAYVFPGLGLGAIVVGARYLPDSVFLVASAALAAQVTQEQLTSGALYPPLDSIRDVSLDIAVAVADHLQQLGLATKECTDIRRAVAAAVYDPTY